MQILLSLLALIFSLSACADDNPVQSPYKEGVHYQRLDTPVRTLDADKIEVAEVFWYGCGHCFRFEPMIHQWSEKLPEDVYLRQTPAMWNKTMEIHARAYYVARALNVLDKVHQPIFNAIILERKGLADSDSLADFFAGYGIDRETFLKTFDSFGVTSQVKQAESRARNYKITGTPEIVIDGTYRVSARLAGGQMEMLKVADHLIARIRAQKNG